MENKMDETINHWMVKAQSTGDKPKDLWEDACRYFMWCEANPIYKSEVIKQTGDIINTTYPRPFNVPALCLHCGITPQYLNSVARNKDAGDWFLVANKILQVIYAQNFEYAMVGIFNANMSIRKLDLGGGDEDIKQSAIINIEVVKEDGVPALSHSEFDKEES